MPNRPFVTGVPPVNGPAAGTSDVYPVMVPRVIVVPLMAVMIELVGMPVPATAMPV